MLQIFNISEELILLIAFLVWIMKNNRGDPHLPPPNIKTMTMNLTRNSENISSTLGVSNYFDAYPHIGRHNLTAVSLNNYVISDWFLKLFTDVDR